MAQKKKSFVEDLNPAVSFISNTEAVTEPAADGKRTRFIFNTPERETKSKRLQLLLKPSTFEGIQARAAAAGTSVNNYINALLEFYLENE